MKRSRCSLTGSADTRKALYSVPVVWPGWMDGGGGSILGFRAMTLSQWRCRLCGFDRYHRVSVLRSSGARYETPFSACSQCSVMFLNATQFDAHSTSSPSVELPPVVTPLRRRRR
jgi:hypothetical protein